MITIHTCESCHTKIPLHFIRGYVHLDCPTCGRQYQLDQASMKKYMLIPLVSVGTAVYGSITFLEGKSIDIKFIFILAVSFVLAGLLGWLAVKANLLHYEGREEK